jgi:ligand-binding SRPBCC domain-containing protein
MKIRFETPIELGYLQIRDKFDRQLFEALSPPGVSVLLRRFDGCKKGDEYHLGLNFLGKSQEWQGVITDEKTTDTEWAFVDEGKVLPWPLVEWKHTHIVEKVSDNSSLIVDDIDFECATPWLIPVVAPGLWLMFAIRPYKYHQYFRK